MELDIATPFTPWASLGGGILIGLSAVMVMGLFGRIAGITGITFGMLGSLLPKSMAPRDWDWRVAFLIGLIAAPLLILATGNTITQTVPQSLPRMAAAGLIVGVGTALGSGCTSGHGVCGLARLSRRSFAAVGTFLLTGFITVYVLRHIVGAV